jgi:dimethylhistidine N-methyltransferase
MFTEYPQTNTHSDNKLSYQENLEDIYSGLQKNQKELSPKFFYNEKGSELFDQICELIEYYPTRTETEILISNIEEMASLISDDSVLIEYGSGSSQKTRILLDNFTNLAAYVSIDISGDYLLNSAKKLSSAYLDLGIIPIAADYTKPIDFSSINNFNGPRVAFYPGSTIGNFYPNEAVAFLKNIRNELGDNGALIVGVDLHKEKSKLDAAYNDEKGITAEFNLNMLRHINTVYDANFDLAYFEHYAFYNQEFRRIEMHLISTKKQSVKISGEVFLFEKDETIRTEVSHKYSLNDFKELAQKANFEVKHVWIDKNNLFSVQYLISQPKN